MGQIVSDSFNRADSNTLGANWIGLSSDGIHTRMPEIVSNQCANGSQNLLDSYGVYTGAAWTGGNDQYAECTPIACQNSNSVGVGVRMPTSSLGAMTGYFAEALAVGSSATHQLTKRVAGTTTSLGTWVGTIASTDVLRVEANGTTINFKVNGTTQITATDNAIASGNPGVICQEDSAAGQEILDNWAAGDFSVAGAGLFMPANLVTGAGGPFFPNPVT